MSGSATIRADVEGLSKLRAAADGLDPRQVGMALGAVGVDAAGGLAGGACVDGCCRALGA